jgi:hypothetical protein
MKAWEIDPQQNLSTIAFLVDEGVQYVVVDSASIDFSRRERRKPRRIASTPSSW